MIIPKEFKNFDDLEAMMLTSLLGTLVSLREDLISIEQARNYWLNDAWLDILTELQASDNLIILVNDCIDLLDKELDYPQLDKQIEKCKKSISDLYTNYDEIDVDLVN